MRAPIGSIMFCCWICLLLAAGAAVPAAQAAQTEDAPQVVRITAKRFAFTPDHITLKQGVPVVLELSSSDTTHGLACPGLNIRSDIPPDKVTVVRFIPQSAGDFPFHCDVFCGLGHRRMQGVITVVP